MAAGGGAEHWWLLPSSARISPSQPQAKSWPRSALLASICLAEHFHIQTLREGPAGSEGGAGGVGAMPPTPSGNLGFGREGGGVLCALR